MRLVATLATGGTLAAAIVSAQAQSVDWEKIDARGVSRVSALALEMAARLAARNDRPEFVPPRRN